MNDSKTNEDIIKKIIESIILPKYPEITNFTIDSEYYVCVRKYTVVLFGNIDSESQTKITRKIKDLFMMASLNVETPAGPRDYVEVKFS
jgi:hypothetical protein